MYLDHGSYTINVKFEAGLSGLTRVYILFPFETAVNYKLYQYHISEKAIATNDDLGLVMKYVHNIIYHCKVKCPGQ